MAHDNHPIRFPSDNLCSYSSTEPGYLHAHSATSPMKTAELIIPKFDIGVKPMKKIDELITSNIAYLKRNGNTFFSTQLVRNGPKCL